MGHSDCSRREWIRRSAVATGGLVTGSLVGTAGVSASDGHDNPWIVDGTEIVAHRGGKFEAPENTRFAMRTAPGRGADVIEMDLFETADGDIVAIHDETVDRTTDGVGEVQEMTVDELQELDASYWFADGCGTCQDLDEDEYDYRGYATGDEEIPDEFGDEYGLDHVEPGDFQIPTLGSILESVPDERLLLEPKIASVDTFVEILENHLQDQEIIVASFDGDFVGEFREVAPEYDTGATFWEIAAFIVRSWLGFPPSETDYELMAVPLEEYGFELVNERLVEDAHAAGVAVYVWTINDPDDMEYLIDIGVDGIVTDVNTTLEELL